MEKYLKSLTLVELLKHDTETHYENYLNTTLGLTSDSVSESLDDLYCKIVEFKLRSLALKELVKAISEMTSMETRYTVYYTLRSMRDSLDIMSPSLDLFINMYKSECHKADARKLKELQVIEEYQELDKQTTKQFLISMLRPKNKGVLV